MHLHIAHMGKGMHQSEARNPNVTFYAFPHVFKHN